MTIREYLEANPKVVADLTSRNRTVKDLAAELGVTNSGVTTPLREMNILNNTGDYVAGRKPTAQAKEERDVHLQQLVQAVIDGKLNADDAADAAGCSKDTIWRHIRRRKAESL